jgi:hypothetical protein
VISTKLWLHTEPSHWVLQLLPSWWWWRPADRHSFLKCVCFWWSQFQMGYDLERWLREWTVTVLTKTVTDYAICNLKNNKYFKYYVPSKTSGCGWSYNKIQNNTSWNNKCIRIKIYKLCNSTGYMKLWHGTHVTTVSHHHILLFNWNMKNEDQPTEWIRVQCCSSSVQK